MSQAYGVLGLYILTEEGVELDAKDEKLIELVKKKTIKVGICEGCFMGMKEQLNILLTDENLDQAYEYLRYDKLQHMKNKLWLIIVIVILIMAFLGIWLFKNHNFNRAYEIGQPIDSLNGVKVYFNGGVNQVAGRNLTHDNYNLGLKYQCVEFVKRYYYEHLNHKMPDSYGHAKDFFNKNVKDGDKNKSRDLFQYTNPSQVKPEVNDLIVFSGTIFNRYGHVAIISEVLENEIEIIQQNPGPFGKSRVNYTLAYKKAKWSINNKRIMGWLRKK